MDVPSPCTSCIEDGEEDQEDQKRDEEDEDEDQKLGWPDPVLASARLGRLGWPSLAGKTG